MRLPYPIRYWLYRRKYDIAKSFRFSGKNIVLYGDGDIIIGENTYIGENSCIRSVKGEMVYIGDDCKIACGVNIFTSTFSTKLNENGERDYRTFNVQILDKVWIGANVVIADDVAIFDNVVIGANTVVTRDVMSGSVFQ